MSDDDRIQFKLMLPSVLKARLEDAAHENRRSLSSEIVDRLDASFSLTAEIMTDNEKRLGALIDDLRGSVDTWEMNSRLMGEMLERFAAERDEAVKRVKELEAKLGPSE